MIWIPLLLVCLSFLAPDSASGASRACRLECQDDITVCVLSTGQRRRKCRRQIYRRCKFEGLTACQPPPTTTTTTTAPPATQPTATTTTTRPVPTSTTLAPFNVTGTWSLSASLISNECGLDVDTFITSTLRLTQSGTTISGTAGTLSVTGDIDYVAGEWEVFTEPSCSVSCCVAIGIHVEPLTNRADVVVASLGRCTDGTQCLVGYSGTISR